MSRLHRWATETPDKLALIESDGGRSMTFAALDARVQRACAWLIGAGYVAGDSIMLLLENRAEIVELGLAARRAGLYFVVVSTHLAPPELAHIVRDSGARMLIVSDRTVSQVAPLCAQLPPRTLDLVCVGDDAHGLMSYETELARADPDLRWDARPLGRDMLYSSGTTGFPKGVRRALVPPERRDDPEPEVVNWQKSFGFDASTVYLSPAPLYHAAPLRYVMRTVEVGGTVVIMRKFDPRQALELISHHHVTHSQWVPTMFVRMLELPESERARYDLASMRIAIHAAAPCPPHVKEAMLDWWGDSLYEYYAGSEGFGVTVIGPREWRLHRGSVGRATLGRIHIVGEDGHELPEGEVGKIYFSGGPPFAYWNDPEKTREAFNDKGWATYGDMGYLDADGYLYLADRRTDLILSGGVNVYPQEIENALILHPDVQDVAVVGVPDAAFGQVPKAIVQLRNPALAGEDKALELVAFCEGLLSRVKMPRTIVFEASLPRLETGKLLRRVLKEKYQSEPEAGHRVRR